MFFEILVMRFAVLSDNEELIGCFSDLVKVRNLKSKKEVRYMYPIHSLWQRITINRADAEVKFVKIIKDPTPVIIAKKVREKY